MDKMNYVMYYEFDNFDDLYECRPCVRHGTTFQIFDCIVKFYRLNNEQITFWVNGENHTKEEAEEIFEKTSKLLSYILALPFYSRDNDFREVQWNLQTNNLLAVKKEKAIKKIEKAISKFDKTKVFFDETLDLLIVAFDNLYKCRKEDAFIYFFKVIERIAKQYYMTYIQRHHTKAVTSKNKLKLKEILKKYASSNLNVTLTEDILNRKVDLLYKEIKMEFYGSVFNKISLFITREKINVDEKQISKLVKLRNKIAHGDTVNDDALTKYLWYCEYLAMQMFSKRFFGESYEKLHIKSYRYSEKDDFYM